MDPLLFCRTSLLLPLLSPASSISLPCLNYSHKQTQGVSRSWPHLPLQPRPISLLHFIATFLKEGVWSLQGITSHSPLHPL